MGREYVYLVAVKICVNKMYGMDGHLNELKEVIRALTELSVAVVRIRHLWW